MKKIIENKKIIILIVIVVLLIAGGLIYYCINNKNDEFIVGKTLKIADSSDYLVQYEDDSYYLMKANADIKFNVSSEDKEIKYKIVDEQDKEIEAKVSKNKNDYVIASNKEYEAGKTYKITLENATFTDEKLKDIKTLYFTIVRPNANTQVLNDNVIKVNQDTITNVLKDNDYYTITSKREFKKDDILYYQNKDEIIAFKVDTIKKENDIFTIKTIAPNLEEIFKELDIYGEFNLRLDDFITNDELKDYIKVAIAKEGLLDHIIPSVYAYENPSITIETRKDGSAKVNVSIDLKHGEKSIFKDTLENHDIKLEIELIVKLKAHSDINLFKAKYDIGANIDIEIKTDFNINPTDDDFKLFESEINDNEEVNISLAREKLDNLEMDSSKEEDNIIEYVIPTPIPGLTVNLEVDLLKELELALKSSIAMNSSINIEFGYNNKGFYKDFDFNVKDNSYDILGKVEAKIGLDPKLNVSFIGVMEAGIKAPLGVYLDGQLNYIKSASKDELDGKLELGAFVSAGLYAEFHVWKLELAKAEATYEKKIPIITLEGTVQNSDLSMYSGTYKSMYGGTEELYIKDNKLYYRFSNGEEKEINFNNKKDDGGIIVYENSDMAFNAIYIYPIGVEFSAVNIHQDGRIETDKTKIRLFHQNSGVSGIESVYYKDDSTNNCEDVLCGDLSSIAGIYSYSNIIVTIENDKFIEIQKGILLGDEDHTETFDVSKMEISQETDGSYKFLYEPGSWEGYFKISKDGKSLLHCHDMGCFELTKQ